MELRPVKNLILKKFDPRFTDFHLWLNAFEFFLDVGKVSAVYKILYLLNNIEADVIRNIQSIIAPVALSDLSYEELITQLEEEYTTRRGANAAKFRFDYRNRYYMESVSHYAYALRKLFLRFRPGTLDYTELTSRFVFGIKNKYAQSTLIKIPGLTFDDALEISKRAEAISIAMAYISNLNFNGLRMYKNTKHRGKQKKKLFSYSRIGSFKIIKFMNKHL